MFVKERIVQSVANRSEINRPWMNAAEEGVNKLLNRDADTDPIVFASKRFRTRRRRRLGRMGRQSSWFRWLTGAYSRCDADSSSVEMRPGIRCLKRILRVFVPTCRRMASASVPRTSVMRRVPFEFCRSLINRAIIKRCSIRPIN